jgi:hypothetical protein
MGKLAQDLVNSLGALVGSVIPWWAPWVFWGGLGLVGLVLVLLLLKLVKDTFGWAGVVTALLAVVSAVSALVGFDRGKKWAEARRPAPTPSKKRKSLF